MAACGAARHVESARRAAPQDLEGAYSLAYDAARKSATALLTYQGLRPTSAGGHIAVVETTRAQFPRVPGLTSLDRLRHRRNQAEYPEPRSYDPITEEEVEDAIRCRASPRCAPRPARQLLSVSEMPTQSHK